MIEFLLARGERAMPLQTLRRMASGGIYDQIGGGFARYSVDARWLVPHFEKMLYDNALLARAYLHAYQVTGEPLFRRVCEETLDWAMRELRQDEGGFASSLDADSEGVEGKFYVWTLGRDPRGAGSISADAAIAHFGVTEAGNFEGANILVRATSDPPEIRVDQGGAARGARGAGAPGARRQAAVALERADDRGAGRRGRGAGPRRLPGGGGHLRGVHRDRAARCLRRACCARSTAAARSSPAFLEDHAYLLEAYLVLYESTFDERWFVARRRARRDDPDRFHDPERGGFFSTAADHTGLIARRKDLEDAPIPRARSAACLRPAPAARLTGEVSYEEAALSLIQLLHTVAPAHPLAFGHLLRAIDFILAPVREVALAGDDVSRAGRAWSAAASTRTSCSPAATTAPSRCSQGRVPVDGRPPPTSASTSPASCRSPAPKNWQSRCKPELVSSQAPAPSCTGESFSSGNTRQRAHRLGRRRSAARGVGRRSTLDELRACGLSRRRDRDAAGATGGSTSVYPAASTRRPRTLSRCSECSSRP